MPFINLVARAVACVVASGGGLIRALGVLLMAKDKIYNWSDAWLLLSIIYAGKPSGATLEKIIAAGDFINHAIFNPDELASGFARLKSGGYIKEKRGIFSATEKVMRAYSKTTSPRRAVHKELEDIEILIGAASSASEQPHSNNLKYAGFSEEAYAEAVKRYIEGFGKS
ncbi:MAG TPA: hypothetical protein VFQ47_01935 [Nitrososphaera sp.]|jgi:hypothetical protein|nr:hypothetical protein [Nitrososphaera sp.]